ncbi:MAG TPA: MFS transporter [Thermoanaerobaculia bacterium]|nr:MFS transporter [Thermoanaerobaculia bacterium]
MSEARGLARLGRALRHPNYRRFFSGQLVSLVGTWMQTVAQSWLVYRLTDSALLLGVVTFANQLPVFFTAPMGGVLADRIDRRRILLATQGAAMVLAGALAGLTLAGVVQVWQVIVLGTLLGFANGFDIPARQAFVAEMVPREDLTNAIALNSSMFNAARVVGPALAGIVVAAAGEGFCFLINALSYAAVIGGLLRIVVPARAQVVHAPAFRSFVEGFRFAAHRRPVRALLLLLAVISFVGMPYTVLMPIFADRILGGGPGALGILLGAAGIGALGGSLTLAARGSLRGLGRLVAISAALFSVALFTFSVSRLFWLSVILLVPVGFSMIFTMASSNTLVQSMVPDALRGRVMALYSMMFIGMAPTGALLAGFLAERIGAPATIAAGGIVSLVASIVFAFRIPALRDEAAELIIAQQMASGQPPDQVTAPGA